MSEFFLLAAAFLTSTLAAVLGAGGGVALIAVMPGLLPAPAVFPIHAVTQLASNTSRLALGWRHIDWQLLPAFAAGGVLGAAAGATVFSRINLDWLPVLMGLVILWITWKPLPSLRGSATWGLMLLGFYQTGLGMLVGATGPLGAALLARRGLQRDGVVVNTAFYMSANHALRVGAFILMGFAFGDYVVLITGLVVAVSLGSWLGTRLRTRIPEGDFSRWFRWLITLLALRLILMGVLP